jgi:hypothetical protein
MTIRITNRPSITGKNGDVAIDEVDVKLNQACSPVSELGSLVTNYCDFETDSCNYAINSTEDEFVWRLSKASYLEKDNTFQTNQGHFMKLQVCVLN